MINKYMVSRISEFLTNCIITLNNDGELPTTILKDHLLNLFKSIDSENIDDELEPIYDAFEILKLADKYYKDHPIVTGWIEEPKDLDVYWDWWNCFRYAEYIYYKNKYAHIYYNVGGVNENT